MGLHWTITLARHFHSSSLYYFHRLSKRMKGDRVRRRMRRAPVQQHPPTSSKSARQLLTLGWTANYYAKLWVYSGGGAVQINSDRQDRVIGEPSNRVPPNEPRCEGREKFQSSSPRWFISHSSSPGGWLIAFSHLGTKPSTFNYAPMVGGTEAGSRRGGRLGRGVKG